MAVAQACGSWGVAGLLAATIPIAEAWTLHQSGLAVCSRAGVATPPSPLVGALMPQGSCRAVAQHVHKVLRTPANLAAAAAAAFFLALLLLAPHTLKVDHNTKHARCRPPSAAAAGGCCRRCHLGGCPARCRRLLWRQHPNEPPRLEKGQAVLGSCHYCPDLASQLLQLLAATWEEGQGGAALAGRLACRRNGRGCSDLGL